MKDYTLSEVKEMCKKHHNGKCSSCTFHENDEEVLACKFVVSPLAWGIDIGDIEKRDLIELPYKVKFAEVIGGKERIFFWQVLSRRENGIIGIDFFEKSREADDFIAKIKGEWNAS